MLLSEELKYRKLGRKKKTNYFVYVLVYENMYKQKAYLSEIGFSRELGLKAKIVSDVSKATNFYVRSQAMEYARKFHKIRPTFPSRVYVERLR